jgi:hypothetical protein
MFCEFSCRAHVNIINLSFLAFLAFLAVEKENDNFQRWFRTFRCIWMSIVFFINYQWTFSSLFAADFFLPVGRDNIHLINEKNRLTFKCSELLRIAFENFTFAFWQFKNLKCVVSIIVKRLEQSIKLGFI